MKRAVICEWDPFNGVVISEVAGKMTFESMVENITFKTESDEQTGLKERIIIESENKTKNPDKYT